MYAFALRKKNLKPTLSFGWSLDTMQVRSEGRGENSLAKWWRVSAKSQCVKEKGRTFFPFSFLNIWQIIRSRYVSSLRVTLFCFYHSWISFMNFQSLHLFSSKLPFLCLWHEKSNYSILFENMGKLPMDLI